MARLDGLLNPATVEESYLSAILDELRGIRKEITELKNSLINPTLVPPVEEKPQEKSKSGKRSEK